MCRRYMEEPLVDQLIVGYAHELDGRFVATGSVTLIRTSKVNILVDCGDPWNGDEILEKLSSHGLQKQDVHVVVVTHGHIDHCGNLSLFPDATVYMGGDIAFEGKYISSCGTLKVVDREQVQHGPVALAPEVELRRCPGHTDHDLIAVVSDTDKGCIVVAGDIFECANDEEQWREVSRYPEQQEKSRSEILSVADWIVPGHGPMFKNEKSHSS